MKKAVVLLAALFLCAFLFALGGCVNEAQYEAPTDVVFLPYDNENDILTESETEQSIPCPKHAILHITHAEFLHSVSNPRAFPNMLNGKIMAGVVPHHNVAATLISGFFSQAANYEYDLVIILAPNHDNDFANIISSYRNWDIGEGVNTNREFVNDLTAAEGLNSAISHRHIEADHSASILIPFIYYFLPGVEVAPVLLNRSLSFGETETLYRWLKNWITESEKNVLLVASVDFSHFLPAPLAREADAVTKDAILRRDLRTLHHMNDHFLDSPAAMIIFLMYLEELGLAAEIAAHTDASEFLGPWIDETTSYMIIVGACAAKK
jgi:AmmeMemoRadiSam system protein B